MRSAWFWRDLPSSRYCYLYVNILSNQSYQHAALILQPTGFPADRQLVLCMVYGWIMTISKNSRGYSYSWGSSPTRLDPCEIVYIRGVHNTYAWNIQSIIPREPVHTLLGYIIFQGSSCVGVFLYEEFNWILFFLLYTAGILFYVSRWCRTYTKRIVTFYFK